MDPAAEGLARLVRQIAAQADAERALEAIASEALDLTRSGHSMIAVLNDELGVLEMSHGAGPGFEELAKNVQLQVRIGEGIIATVAATGKTVLANDVASDPIYQARFEQTRSEIAVPVQDRFGRVRGVLNVEADYAGAYQADDVSLAETCASMIALILERRDQSARQDALLRIGQALDSAFTEEALISQVIHVARDVLRYQACSLFLLDEKTDTFVLRGSTSALRDQIGQIRYERGEGCTGWVCDEGLPALLSRPQEDPRWRGRYLEFPSEEIAGFLAVPIVYRGESIGAIRALRRKPENPFLDVRFTEDDQRVLQAIGEQVATALKTMQSIERVIRSERMIAWGELSAKSSHMIGNRVFAIKGDVNELGYLLSEEPLPKESLAEIQGSLRTNVLRIEEILNEFRDFVNATRLSPDEADLNEVIRETCAEMFPKRGAFTLKLELDDSMPSICLDVAKFRRALGELIENALIHMTSGELAIRSRYEKRETGPSWARVEVEDSGPGVTGEEKALIFRPFYGGKASGMGLGLSIVKGIIDAHGGQVFEDGEPGHGARFVILLPA